MGFRDSVSRAFGSLRSLSDEELREEHERLRQRWLQLPYEGPSDIARSEGMRAEMKRYDDEMTRRLNEAHLRENPNPTRRHREHGWYLPNDD